MTFTFVTTIRHTDRLRYLRHLKNLEKTGYRTVFRNPGMATLWNDDLDHKILIYCKRHAGI